MADSGGAEKSPEKEDRLGALPDSLIHHILSFLPSTKQAIQTGILSKRWLNQWTFVSNLIFDFSGMDSDYSRENIALITSSVSRIIKQTLFLHQCSTIHKFQITTGMCYVSENDPNCEAMIHFVVRKKVEDLILNFDKSLFRLPEFFFTQPSLVKLKLSTCSLRHTGMVNWGSLKDLSIESCSGSCEVIRNIVSGSPLLQSLEFKDGLYGLKRLVIASKSLKRLVVIKINCFVDVSCPNLVEFELETRFQNFGWCDKVLEKFLCDSPLLESLSLKYFELSNVRIASDIMKKIVFMAHISHEIAISCPNLEELCLRGNFEAIRLMNLPSSVCVSLGLVYHKKTGVRQILESVQHLNELKFGSSFIETLSDLEMEGASHPRLRVKSLTLESKAFGRNFADFAGIVFALRSSPLLERLVVNLSLENADESLVDLSELDYFEENCWNSNEARFSSLVSHLKTVKITGFSHRLVKPKAVLDFVEFILKNATVLDKMVVTLDACGTDFVIKVCQKLLSFPRCSASATVELLCSH